jgi:hypothetical protein
VATDDPPETDVHDRIDLLTAELAIAREAWELAERRAAHAEARLRTVLALAQEQAGVGYRVEKVISLANLQAAGIRSQAETDAAAIREGARAAAVLEVERMMAAAKDEVERLRASGGEGPASIAARQAREERNRSGPDHRFGGEGPASIAARQERNRSGPDHQVGGVR